MCGQRSDINETLLYYVKLMIYQNNLQGIQRILMKATTVTCDF